jgi:hypothetical protein
MCCWGYSPPEAGAPGWRLYVPFYINRNVPWFPYARDLLAWTARSQWLLQSGGPIAEAVFYGVRPTGLYPSDVVDKTTFRHLAKGKGDAPYEFTYLVVDGKTLDIGELSRVAELIDDGVVVVCNESPKTWPAIKAAPGSGPDDAQLVARFDRYEREKKVQVVRDKLGDWLGRNSSVVCEGNVFRWVHRRVKGGEIYLVMNADATKKDPVTANVRFAHPDMVPEIWDADTGTVSQAALYRRTDAGVEIPIRLGPLESCFIVFAREPRQLHAVRMDADSVVRDAAGALHAVAQKSGEYRVELSDGRSSTFRVAVPEPLDIKGSWGLTADPKRGYGLAGETVTRTMEKLDSWKTVETLKKYEGIVTYTTSFDLPDAWAPKEAIGLQLDLGEVCQVAEVFVNGKQVGTAWHPPYQMDITGHARAGKNELKIDVANHTGAKLYGLIGPVLIRPFGQVKVE